MILVREDVYYQNLNDANMELLSIISYSRWRPRWPPAYCHDFGKYITLLAQQALNQSTNQ